MGPFEESASLVPPPLLDALGGGASVSGRGLGGQDQSCRSASRAELVGLVAAKAEHALARSDLQRLTDHEWRRHAVPGGRRGHGRGSWPPRTRCCGASWTSTRCWRCAFLKDLNSKQSIAIEPACQADFGRLLVAAATGSVSLRTRRQDLAWASSFVDAPSMWEGRLAPLTVAVEECHAYHAQLTARARALAEFTAMQQRGAGQQQLGAECT
jgi:hypothetical protein